MNINWPFWSSYQQEESKTDKEFWDPGEWHGSGWKVSDPDPIIKFEKLREDAFIPSRKNARDAGLDLALPADHNEAEIQPGKQKLLMLGIRAAIPCGYEGQIRPRSSFALDRKLTVPNTPGTIDAGYRKEIGVILYNYGDDPQTVGPGDRIAQLVINEIWQGMVVESEVDENGRGGGFGSTGK